MKDFLYRISGPAFMMLFAMVLIGFPGMAHTEETGQDDLGPTILAARTMSRTADFIIVHGRETKNNLHKKSDLMTLFAAIDGVVQPVPFQVDEINEEGIRVLPLSPPTEKESKGKVEKDDDDGRLDENDELIFMIWDTGDRIDKKGLPEGVLSVDEIRIEDELDGGLSWVYLCSFASDPPCSDVDYAKYDTVIDHVITRNFDNGFSEEVPLSYNYMSFQGGPNLLDVYKMRFHIKIFGIKMMVDETRFDAKLHAYKDGPVRVIRMVRSQVYMNRWMKSPSGYSTTIYLANSTVLPYTMKIPVNMYRMKRFLKVKMRAGTDFQGLSGWKAKSEADPRWLDVDGKMDETEMNVNTENATWIILSGPEYGMLMRMIWDRKQDGTYQEPQFTSDCYYIDDEQAPDPPEFFPGQVPNMGFWMHGLEELKKGTYFFYVLIHTIEKPWEEKIEKEYLNIMDHPLKIAVN